MPYPVGKSSYPDLYNEMQYVASLAVANQVASLCYEFDTQVAKNGDRLTVNEGIRSIERQILLYNRYLHQGGALAATVYPGPPPKGTSTHDPSRGSALDFGITSADGVNRALTQAEFDWLHMRAPYRGILWTGANFVRVEPWHHNGGYVAVVDPIPGVNLPGEPLVKESSRPSEPTVEETDTLKITFNAAGKIPVVWNPASGKSWKIADIRVAGAKIGGGQVLALMRRWINADQSKTYPEKFNDLEVEIIRAVIRRIA